MRNFACYFGVAVITLASAPAYAGTASSTMGVSATVTENCTVSTTPVAFGSINPLAAGNADASGAIAVTCTNGTAWTATANVGSGSGATQAVRKMTFSTNTLNYSLYVDGSRSSVWGDGTGSTATVTNTGTGSTQNATIYGRVPSGQSAAVPGSYADTVSVTITY